MNRLSLRALRPFLAVLATLALAGAAGRDVSAASPIVTTDMLRQRHVGAIDVSWDGSRAVLAVRSIEQDAGGADDAAEARWTNRSHLWLLDLRDRAAPPRRLTFGDRFDHSPVIGPDGRRVAFVRSPADEGDDDDDAQAQVWILPLDGGEAHAVTDLPRGASLPAWSPDGRRLLVSSSVPFEDLPGAPGWPLEAPGRDDATPTDGVTPRADGTRAEIRAWLDRNARDGDPVVLNRLDFQQEQHLADAMRFRHLFVVDLPTEPGTPAVARRVTGGFHDHGDAAWLPDGAGIVCAAKRRDGRHPDRVLEREIRLVTLDGTRDETLLALDGERLGRPRPSRDGTVLAFAAERTDEPAHRQTRLGIVSMAPGGASEPVWLTDENAIDVGAFAWLPARSALVFTAPREGGYPLMSMGVGLLEPSDLVAERDGLPVGVHAFGAGGGTIVYAETSAANPCRVRMLDARGDRLAFDLNAWVSERELSRPEERWITRPDGRRVQAWIMEPTRREPSRAYPLCLEIHGGPSAMWGPGERSMWFEFQLLCSRGYGVVYANPRGSGGYGYDFRRANYQDWGEGPGGDVLAAVDEAVREEWVDPGRLVVTGGSYGGYLTAWVVAHDHRFKAAVAQRGVYDMATFFGEGNAWRLVEWSMGGRPWDARTRTVLQRESPFTVVNRIRTPLLIMHASNDLRTGVSQSEMMYRALKALDRPVEYVRYPNAGHDLSRTGNPHQRLDRLNRIVDFFERHVDDSRGAPAGR